MGLDRLPGPSDFLSLQGRESRRQWGVCGSEEAAVTSGNGKGAIRGSGASQTLRWGSEGQGIVRDISEQSHCSMYPGYRAHPWECAHAPEAPTQRSAVTGMYLHCRMHPC